MFRRIISIFLIASFIFQQVGFAQAASEINIAGYLSQMRSIIAPDKFRPMHLRYFSYDSQNNNFKALLDKGDAKDIKGEQLETSSRQLLSYFLVGVTLPNESFWVNLRPDREDQIIDDALGTTDVGKILLEADLQLKKDTARFTSPETVEGKEYWDKLYRKAGELYGSDHVTIPTLTRPWIVPSEVIIREGAGSAYVYKATLKVMLEQDHIKNSEMYNFSDERAKALNEYSSELIRQNILPKLTKEINISKRYVSLRQVFYSLILSRWFKERFNGQPGSYASLIDQKNLAGLTSKESWSKSTYFQAYQKSFQDGEYNIAKQVDTPTGQVIRTYFSGGIALQESLPNTLTAASPIGTFSSPHVELPKILVTKGQVEISGREGQGNDPLGGAYAVNDNSAGSPVRLEAQEKKNLPSASPINAQVSADKLTWKEAFGFAGYNRPFTARNLMKIDRLDEIDENLVLKVSDVLLPKIRKPEIGALFRRWIERGESWKTFFVLSRITSKYSDPSFQKVAYEQIGEPLYQRMLTEAVESRDGVLLRYATRDLYLTDQLKRTIFERGDSKIKESLIGNKSGLPRDIQEKIVREGSVSLKTDLAYQYYTHPEVMSMLAKDADEEVLMAVAYNEKAPMAVLRSLVDKESNRIAYALKRNKAVGYDLFMVWLHEREGIKRQKTLEEREKRLTAYEAKIKERGEPSRAEITVYAEGAWSEYKQFVLPLAPLHNIAGVAGLIPHKKAVKFVIEGAKPDIENFVEALRKWAVIQDIEVKWGEYKKEFFAFGIVEKSRRKYYYSDEGGSRVIDDSWGLGDYVLAGLVVYTLFGQDNETITESGISSAPGGFGFDSPEDEPQSSVHETEETSISEASEPSGDNDSSSPLSVKQEKQSFLSSLGQTLSYYWLRMRFFREYRTFEKEYGFNKEQLETMFMRLAQKPQAREGIDQLKRFAYYASVAGFLDEKRMLYYTALDDWDADGYGDGPHYALDKNILEAVAYELVTAENQKTLVQKIIAMDKENEKAKLNVQERQSAVLNVLRRSVAYEVIKARLESVPEERSLNKFFAETLKLQDEGILPKDADVETWDALNALAHADPTLTTAMGRFLDDMRLGAIAIVAGRKKAYAVIKARLESVPEEGFLTAFFAEAQKLQEEGVLPNNGDVDSWDALNALAYEDPTLTASMGRFLDDKRHSAKRMAEEAKAKKSSSAITEESLKAGITVPLATEAASSAITEETKKVPEAPGGIDFRVIDIKYQPMGLFKGLNYTLPLLSQAELDKINIDEEIKQVQVMIENGVIPSGKRIKELVAASSQKGELNKRMDDLLVCLADICRLEEENVAESAPEMREALVILDAGRIEGKGNKSFAALDIVG